MSTAAATPTRTTWKIGGPARWLCRVRNEAGLAGALAAASASGAPVALLGMGSKRGTFAAGCPTAPRALRPCGSPGGGRRGQPGRPHGARVGR